MTWIGGCASMRVSYVERFTMPIINFKSGKAAAFKGGFWKGLGAPYLLFCASDLKADAPKSTGYITPYFSNLQAHPFTCYLEAVGNDFYVSLARYGEEVEK